MKRTFVRKSIKAQAWVKLHGSWLKAFGIIIIQLVLSVLILSFLPLRIPPVEEMLAVQDDAIALLRLFLPTTITRNTIALTAVTIILYTLVISPLSIGICRFFIKIAKGKPAKFSDAFQIYTNLKSVFGSVWLNVLIFLISMFWSVVFMLVPIVLISLCLFAKMYFVANVLLSIVPALAIFSLLWNSRYSFAMYIYAEGEKSAFASLLECIKITKKRKLECIVLRASYFLWDVASTYVLPLGYVYAALSGTVYASYLYYFRGGEKVEQTEVPPTF